MALSTYAELKASIASWLIRSDLTADIPDFIRMAEARFNRELKCRDMRASTDLTVATGEATVPPYFRRVISMTRTGTDAGRVLYEPYDRMAARDATQSGAPVYYDRVSDKFLYWPATDATVKLWYERELPVLSDSNTSNWLLAKHPDAYLYASLMASAPRIREDERIALWKGLADEAIASINRADRNEQGDGIQIKAGVMVV